MTTLDEPMGYIDPKDVSPQPTALRYGVIWGLLGILLGLIAYLAGWTDVSGSNAMSGGSMISSILSIALNVTILVMAIKYHRDKELGGYITFGRGFKTGMLTTFFYAIIAALWMAVFINFIATDMMENIQNAMYEQWEAQGLSDEQIEQAQQFTGFMQSKTVMVAMAFFGT